MAVRPPLARLLLYGIGFRLPDRYDDWVFRDLTSRGWRLREVLRIMAIALPFTIGAFFLPGELALRELTASFFVFGPGLVAIAYSDEFRDYRLRQHGLLPPSEPDPDRPS